MRATELELDALGGDVRGDREKPVQASREVAGRCGDAPLSGVARIVYETAAGRRSVEGPSVMLTIGAEGVTTVNYFAVDKGGNVEPAKTIVVRIARPVQPQPQPNRTRAVGCVVPRLKGRTLPAARRSATKARCRIGRVVRRRSARRHGRVFRQRPAPGKRLRQGGRITVYVSLGPRRR